MKTRALKILVAAAVAIMVMGASSPVAADIVPMQAPTETDMNAAMGDAAEWMLTIVGTDGQMSPPFGSPVWEVESGGRLCMNGLALLRAYQTTGDQSYMDRAVNAGDLAAASIDAGSKYVIDRTGVLPTEAYGGFPNAQPGMVDDDFQTGFSSPVTFKLWETVNGIWFLTELYLETGSNAYVNAVVLLDRLVALQMYNDDDMGLGLHGSVGLRSDGTWTTGARASMFEMGLLLHTITVGGQELNNLWKDRYSLVSYIRPQQNTDGSFDDGFDLPNQDSQSETRHAVMVPALFDIGVPREANKLVDWVKSQLQGDGHYSCPHDKYTVVDTASAALGLLPVGEVTEGGEAVSWLIGRQRTDGSWEAPTGLDIETSRMMSTYWAMLAIGAGLTNYNLILKDTMVSTEAIWEGDPSRVMGHTVNVTVENDGLVTVVGATVKVFDGPKGGGNQPLDTATITVPALGSAPASLEFRPAARGPHDVHVWVEYSNGGEFRTRDNNVSMMLNLNREPTGRIEMPTQGQLFGFGAVIEFRAADIMDLDEDPVTITWVDDVSGFMSNEVQFHQVLLPGDHFITLTFEDGNGPSTQANVSFSVRENIPPTIRISTPADGARYFDYERVTFDASASSDAEEHYLYFTWESHAEGMLGTGATIHKRLGPGQHLITVWVDDTWDNVSKSVSIRIIETFPPDILISSPMDGETLVTTTRVEFDATETTDPDSEILEYFWYSNIDGLLSERPSFLAKLSVGTHTITIAVTDNNFNVTKQITIHVLSNRPPVSSISDPEHDSSFYSDDMIELNGSESYDLEDPITYFWVSDRSGSLGVNTITLWVDDDHGHNVSTSITINILNRGPTAGISSPELGTSYATGNPVIFNSATSSDPEGDTLLHEWFVRSFGTGEWSTLGSQARVQRTFEVPGEYEVRLVVLFIVSMGSDGDGNGDGELVVDPLRLGILIVIVVAVVGIAVFIMRSRA
jgi:hypothetical protein